jgi:hypothetical protein
MMTFLWHNCACSVAFAQVSVPNAIMQINYLPKKNSSCEIKSIFLLLQSHLTSESHVKLACFASLSAASIFSQFITHSLATVVVAATAVDFD